MSKVNMSSDTSPAESTRPAARSGPGGANRWIALVVLSLAQLMVILDGTVSVLLQHRRRSAAGCCRNLKVPAQVPLLVGWSREQVVIKPIVIRGNETALAHAEHGASPLAARQARRQWR